jgi:ABC-type branched-subunit amino acid transport system substrate-binding protein
MCLLKTQAGIDLLFYSLQMRKVKSIGAVLLITAGVIYLVSIGNAKPLAPALKVGVLVSDSGALRFAGPIQRAAAKIAVRDLAVEETPLKVELSFADIGDTETENKRAIAKLRALGVDVLIAPIESSSAEVLVETIQKKQIPIISTAPLADDLGSSNSKQWHFRLATSPSQDSFALAKFIADSTPKNVLVVSGSLLQNREQQKSLSFGLILSGIKVQTAGIKDLKTIAKTKPDALVLLSMEESLGFFSSMADWVAQVPDVYLVPSNLGDYSFYPWAKSLKGARALSPKHKIDPELRSDLSKELGNLSLVGPLSMTLLNLAQRTSDAVKLAADAFRNAKRDSPEKLRQAIADAKVRGKDLFTEHGFLGQREYSVFRYGSSGTFSQGSVFSPN